MFRGHIIFAVSYFILSIFCLTISSAQNTYSGKMSLTINFDKSVLIPKYLLIKQYSIGGFLKKTDTCLAKDKHTFEFSAHLEEPVLLSMAIPQDYRLINGASFWVFANNYNISINENFNFDVHEKSLLDSTRLYSFLESKAVVERNQANAFLNLQTYAGLNRAEIEQKISKYKDSVFSDFEDKNYPYFIQEHKNSAAALHALCQYAEMPLSNPRKQSKPLYIQNLLEHLGANVRALPSAQTLLEKISIGQRISVGNQLPDIALDDNLGRKISISSLKGNTILIDFWASWCIPCRDQIPELKELYSKYAHQNFKIVSVTIDEKSNQSEWLNLLEKYQIKSWINVSDFDKKAKKLFDVRAIPSNILLDAEGKIIARNIDMTNLKGSLKHIFSQ